MNARGVLYDYLNYNSRTLFKRFDATGVKIATSLRGSLNVRTDTDKRLEPRGDDPVGQLRGAVAPPAGCRDRVESEFQPLVDGVQPNRRMSIWSDPQNNESWPHVPSRFGEIVFVE